jgi:ABC-type nitrate/sulfonate/bicarbonate transport system substrate-binding protein
VLLGGIHVGCFELFGGERVRAVRDLRGRKVTVPELGNSHHIFASMMASHVGIDPKKDIEWAGSRVYDAPVLPRTGPVYAEVIRKVREPTFQRQGAAHRARSAQARHKSPAA